MTEQALNWKMVTQAGEGVMLAAKLFAKTCKRSGWQAFNYYEYLSLIKGAWQSGQVFAHSEVAHCQRRELDMLVLFHEKFLIQHLAELTEHSIVVVNSKLFDVSKYPDLKAKVLAIPMTQLARQSVGNPLVTNIVALGVSACVLGLDLSILSQVIKDEFLNKKKVIADNLQALSMGCEVAQQMMRDQGIKPLKNIEETADESILLSGNEAVGLGALAGGLQFYSAYPMTPASGLLHYLADQQSHYPLVVKHSEDEIAAINQALGASYAGLRAMTGSSGGGYALMVEATSLSGVAELPLVILEAMRQGPATGLPTWTSQADLNFIIHAGHGDFLKVVLTPGNVEEHYQFGRLAQELAEKYQLPVFILSDKFLLESQQSMPKPELLQTNDRYGLLPLGNETENYLRYQDSETGVSARALPGVNQSVHLTNSYEHDEAGFATEEAETTKRAIEKRARKLSTLLQDLPKPQLFGCALKEAAKVLISFGSTINVLQETLRLASLENFETKAALVHLNCVAPLADLDAILADLPSNANIFTVEGNATAQLASLIQSQSQLKGLHSVLRYDGRPFYAEDLLTWLKTDQLPSQYTLKSFKD